MAGLLSLLKKKQEPQVCLAIVVAAGSSQRMEGVEKITAPLGELPVIVHTLFALCDCPAIDEVMVVTREDLLVEISQLCKEFSFTKVSKVLVGGDTRTSSVEMGLREARKDATLIAIHDGARPLVQDDLICQVVACAAKTGAAAPAIPVTDTIKQGREGLVEQTLERAGLWAVQTPQVFQADLIRAAIHQAVQEGVTLSDDCAAVERLGMKVTLTPGSRENIKLTTPVDFIIGEAILEARVRGLLP